MATLENNHTRGYYLDIPDTDAQAICDEWNQGLARKEWRVIRTPLPTFNNLIGDLFS